MSELLSASAGISDEPIKKGAETDTVVGGLLVTTLSGYGSLCVRACIHMCRVSCNSGVCLGSDEISTCFGMFFF